MNEPTTDDRVDLWRFVYSRSSLLEARATAEILLRGRHGFDHYHRIALVTALVVTYARPFSCAQVTSTRRVVPMDGISIPEEFKELHAAHLEMRHQVFGHKDATGPVMDHGVINEVHFIRKGDFVDLHTVVPGDYADEKLTATCTLIDALVHRLDEQIYSFVESYPLPIHGDGVYRLNIHDAKSPWVEKVRDE